MSLLPRSVRWFALALSLAAVLPAPAAQVLVTARHGHSLRGTIDGHTFLLLRGNHYQRGFDHGYLAAHEIVAMLGGALVPALEQERAGLWDQQFVPLMRRFTFEQRYQQELAGMLAGIEAALPDPKERTLAALGRPIGIDDLKVGQCLSDILGMGCSSFSAWGSLTPDGQVMTGRNLDYTAFPVTRFTTILAIAPSEPGLKATVDVMFPGSIGASTAMNADGVFAALHDGAVRATPDETSGNFTPRVLAIRSALETADPARPADDIAEKLRQAHPTMGSNLHVSAPIRADDPATLPAILEWDMRPRESGVTVRRLTQGEAPTGLVCTNHFERREGPGSDDSSRRYSRLNNYLGLAQRDHSPLQQADAQKLLNAVSRNGQAVTFLSCIVWPAQRRFALAVSPQDGVSATKGQWIEFAWDDLMGPQ